jgi:hypothetical protein
MGSSGIPLHVDGTAVALVVFDLDVVTGGHGVV